MGRKLKEIDPKKVRFLASRFCSKREIAAVLDCDEKTIRNRFNEEVERGREQGKAKLRIWQLKKAKEGNAAALIWLGKQYLGQKDMQHIKAEDGKTIEITERIVSKSRKAAMARTNGNGNGHSNGNGTAPGAGRFPQ